MPHHTSSIIYAISAICLLGALFQFPAPVSGNVCSSTVYTLSENIKGAGFFDAFDFQTIIDPTGGRVNYTDKETAQRNGLAFAGPGSDRFVLRADNTTTLTTGGPGRNSFRIRSKKNYTTHVAIFNIRHMPQGCGTWPAIWEVHQQIWPRGGEVDILEGVNDVGPNTATLHTSPGCSMPQSRYRANQLGVQLDYDCDANIAFNTGCSVESTRVDSYGPAFNNIGGGWYAVERNSRFIKFWFWPRNDIRVPADVQMGHLTVSPDDWGTPMAYFPGKNCDIGTFFTPHNIIINLTFCGDYSGNRYSESGCPGTCVDYVNKNPQAFSKAYFDLANIRVYLP